MSTVTVTEIGDNTTVVVTNDAPQVITVQAQGPAGPQGATGPDPWAEPVQRISASGIVTINYALGKHVILTVTGNITSLTVINWPAQYAIARLTFEIINTGSYNIALWTGVKWPSNGLQPTLTPNGEDLIVLLTSTGGSRIQGNTVGQAYTLP